MERYIHIKDIKNFIEHKEKRKFKIVKSEAYGIRGDMGFKLIIPDDVCISKMEVLDVMDEDSMIPFKIMDKKGHSVMKNPNVVLWNNELYSTDSEESVCVLDDDMDNGLVFFSRFKKVPEFVSSEEIIADIEGMPWKK